MDTDDVSCATFASPHVNLSSASATLVADVPTFQIFISQFGSRLVSMLPIGFVIIPIFHVCKQAAVLSAESLLAQPTKPSTDLPAIPFTLRRTGVSVFNAGSMDDTHLATLSSVTMSKWIFKVFKVDFIPLPELFQTFRKWLSSKCSFFLLFMSTKKQALYRGSTDLKVVTDSGVLTCLSLPLSGRCRKTAHFADMYTL